MQCQKFLSLSRGGKPTHVTFPLASRFVRNFGSVVRINLVDVTHGRHDRTMNGAWRGCSYRTSQRWTRPPRNSRIPLFLLPRAARYSDTYPPTKALKLPPLRIIACRLSPFVPLPASWDKITSGYLLANGAERRGHCLWRVLRGRARVCHHRHHTTVKSKCVSAAGSGNRSGWGCARPSRGPYHTVVIPVSYWNWSLARQWDERVCWGANRYDLVG